MGWWRWDSFFFAIPNAVREPYCLSKSRGAALSEIPSVGRNPITIRIPGNLSLFLIHLAEFVFIREIRG
jgi:hypothetical protein